MYLFFFNPTIEIVTFRLRGRCMLGVFLLPTFTRLGHDCQDLLSPCESMYVCRLDHGLYSHPKEFFGGNEVKTHVNSKGKIPSTGKRLSSEEDRTHDTASSMQDSEPNMLTTSYSAHPPPPPPPQGLQNETDCSPDSMALVCNSNTKRVVCTRWQVVSHSLAECHTCYIK